MKPWLTENIVMKLLKVVGWLSVHSSLVPKELNDMQRCWPLKSQQLTKKLSMSGVHNILQFKTAHSSENMSSALCNSMEKCNRPDGSHMGVSKSLAACGITQWVKILFYTNVYSMYIYILAAKLQKCQMTSS